MVDKILPFIKAYPNQISDFMLGPLSIAFFIILIAGFVGYLIMKKSIFGAIIFQLIAMMFVLATWPFLMLVFAGG